MRAIELNLDADPPQASGFTASQFRDTFAEAERQVDTAAQSALLHAPIADALRRMQELRGRVQEWLVANAALEQQLAHLTEFRGLVADIRRTAARFEAGVDSYVYPSRE